MENLILADSKHECPLPPSDEMTTRDKKLGGVADLLLLAFEMGTEMIVS